MTECQALSVSSGPVKLSGMVLQYMDIFLIFLFEHIWVFVLHSPSSSDVPVFMLDQPIDGFQSRDKTAMLAHKTMANYGSCFAK